MGPELIIKYNILRMSFSYAVLTTLQEAVDKKTIETFGYMPNIVYLKFKGIWHNNVSDRRQAKRKRISFCI